MGEAPSSLSCFIHKHFADSPHEPSDLSFSIVDGIPQRFRAKPALIPALRLRLQFIWIHRLEASLNKRLFLHHSFSGARASRNDAET